MVHDFFFLFLVCSADVDGDVGRCDERLCLFVYIAGSAVAAAAAASAASAASAAAAADADAADADAAAAAAAAAIFTTSGCSVA